MAAYVALVSLAQTINQILNHDSYSISLRKKEEIASIQGHLIFLQAFLDDFPNKSNNRLEAQIRDVANQIEDSIEYSMLKQSRLRYGLIESTVGRSKVKSQHHRRHAANWNELLKKIISVAGEVKRIKNSARINQVRLDPASSPSKLSPSHKKDAMIGLDDDLMAIKEQLCGESSTLQVIPIVGMGGIGKTTLAGSAYRDPLIMEHFQIHAWVTISQDYSASEILSSLLYSMKEFNTGRSGQSNELDVYQRLKGRRYLIVMDDIWSTKAWDDVRRIFPDDHNGSRIMLTTRLADVAAYANSSRHLHHEMHLMGTDQSWDLLLQEVFGQELCPPELENIGKDIARSCQGLPLAIVVVAGLLSTLSKTRASWEEIAKNVNSAIATKDGQFEKILSLSYTYLPHHLRPCFLYMGAFPENCEINVLQLSRLWVAEGFVKPSESKNLEEMAEEYLEDLVKRSLILVSERKSNGKIKNCELHDVVRELCIRKAQQEKFHLHLGRHVPRESIKVQRRVSITRYKYLNTLENIYGSTIRTILCFNESEFSQDYLGNNRLLRVLDLESSYSFMVDHEETVSPSAQVFELFHLRYLSFCYTQFPISIPAAISNLQNLQTLIIHQGIGHPLKVSLPLEIWMMPQLRHLVCCKFDGLPNPKEGATSTLENLQTLSEVANLKCTENILKMIPNVKKLGIDYDGEESDQDYHVENLVHLQQLEKLNLTVDDDSVFSPVKFNPSFPRMLKKLSLCGMGLPWEHMMKIVCSLPNLQILKLCYSHPDWTQWETSEGDFPQLKFLLIDTSQLHHWISETNHFPRLECLLLQSCSKLEEIPNDIGEIPTLGFIEVQYCTKSVAESAKRIQEDQQSNGNDVLRVHCRDNFY